MLVAGMALQSGIAAAQLSPTTSFSYTSQTGDYLGQGQSASYSPPTASFNTYGNKTSATISVDAGSSNYWYITLAAPVGQELRPGSFVDAERASFRTGRSPGLDVSGQGRGCNQTWGSFIINQVSFDSTGKLTVLDATFTQRCASTGPAFNGTIKFNALPLYLSLQSETGDYIGQGIKKSYFNDKSIFTLSGTASSSLRYTASGLRDSWNASIAAPTGKTLQIGTYTTARFADATNAGFSFTGNGRGCNATTGSLRINSITFDSVGAIKGLNATFSQRCDNSTGLLSGTIAFMN